jgi:hypothetical protein
MEANVMKRYAIPVVVIFAVLALTLSAFVQAQDRANQRQSMRERMQNMSEEERAKYMEQRRARGGGFSRMMVNPEAQQKAIKAIEEQLVKLKAVAQIQRPEGGFQNMSEEDRNKMITAFRDRRTALQAITAQVALLEGRRQPEGEGARFIIINTADLKPIQEAATKEKAEETSQLLERLMARGSGRGRGGSGQRPQGGQGRQRQQ